jgi:transposase
METNPMLERQHFVQDLKSGHWSMTELCLRYGISRITGYKWLDRFRQGGVSGLHDRSRAPRSCPHQTADELVEYILAENRRYGWGARKVLKRLEKRFLAWTGPHAAPYSIFSNVTAASVLGDATDDGSIQGPPPSTPPLRIRSGPLISKASSSCATVDTATLSPSSTTSAATCFVAMAYPM